MKLQEYPAIGEQVWSGKLPNGLTVFVVPKRGFHKSFAVFATDYGGADRRFKLSGKWHDTPEGVAHFLEHKMFDTKDGNALSVLGANGASPNAFTSTDITAYYFECIEMFTENLKTLLSFVSVPWFTPESVEKEQGIIGQEIRMYEDEPEYCLYFGLLKSLYSHNPLRDSVAGTVESIAEITAATLYDCHKIFYNPSNMALCVTGDVDPAAVFEIARDVLPEEAGEIPERDYGPKESLLPVSASFSKAMEVSLPMFLAGCKVEAAAKGRDSLRLELVSALALEMLAGHSSPLYIRLYGQGLVTDDFSASLETMAGAAHVVFGGETRDPERVFCEVKGELARLAGAGADPELFGRLKKAMVGSQIRSLNSFDAICENVVTGHFRGYDAFEAAEIVASITMDEVTAFLSGSLVPDNMAISIITPNAVCGPQGVRSQESEVRIGRE